MAQAASYTVKAAAKYLSVSTDTIHAWIKAGVLRGSTLCPRKFLIPANPSLRCGKANGGSR
ncbi:MAG: excisionase family DNA-binding protein [Chthoniobacterales bacterium]